jgi:hypothetical protein
MLREFVTSNFENLEDLHVALAAEDDIESILDLQERNAPKSVTAEERKRLGFVPIQVTHDWLFRLVREEGVIVARLNGEVVGYLLASSLERAREISILKSYFQIHPELRFVDRPLHTYRACFMEQVCVDLPLRGKGIVLQLYRASQRILGRKYEIVISQISGDNPRSLNLHLNKIGFQVVHTYEDREADFLDTGIWHVVVWDFKNAIQIG